MAVADLTITSRREEIINFSVPFMHSGMHSYILLNGCFCIVISFRHKHVGRKALGHGLVQRLLICEHVHGRHLVRVRRSLPDRLRCALWHGQDLPPIVDHETGLLRLIRLRLQDEERVWIGKLALVSRGNNVPAEDGVGAEVGVRCAVEDAVEDAREGNYYYSPAMLTFRAISTRLLSLTWWMFALLMMHGHVRGQLGSLSLHEGDRDLAQRHQQCRQIVPTD
jgi:hypothetical protein